MTTSNYYNYTQEQRDKIVELLLKIQMNMDNPEIIDEAIKNIYKIIYSETVQRIYNPVTGTYYDIRKRSSVYDGEVKGLWRKKDDIN
jgi:uncharacterized protein YicC (UPF0701 family)